MRSQIGDLGNLLAIPVGDQRQVSGLLQAPRGARACYVLAHGAGAGMLHPFMASVADGLAERGVATLRYQFPYMEEGRRRPDAPELAQATVRAAVAEASRLLPELALVAGGKSFGGRMTSQAQAKSPLPGVRGLAFLGFPLHPAGRPSDERAVHLFEVEVPMLFLQGTRDALADTTLMEQLVMSLGKRATLKLFPDADHSFHVPARTGRRDAEVMAKMLDALSAWLETVTVG
ncbi:MAG: alpha/beta hydrolase family protein [Methyloceanibacter sp.]|uniref:alpha/beta hydrolase family protein n=1 Tax=Methyloceanibacter sp. TaxID=1965321 RepID=UPI003D6D3C03